ncbi:MAG: HupE/UreJ family protein [Acidobacteria bacterium]|nr:HupE/UreJ family protein [Acidobacteriota bacterium]
MAFENILGIGQERRWTAAFGFGLVHGFGFSFALSESLQFAGSHLLTSLLAFNLGVELGQLLVLLLLIPLLDFVFRRLPNERHGIILISALIVHTAWHWTGDRGANLLQYRPAPRRSPAMDSRCAGSRTAHLAMAAETATRRYRTASASAATTAERC